MKAEPRFKVVTFRPNTKNRERLTMAADLGGNLSELINDVLQAHLKPKVEKLQRDSAERLRAVIEAAVP